MKNRRPVQHSDVRKALPSSPPSGGRDAACAALLVLAVLAIAAPGISVGGLGWSDAPQHTFDGIFILEFFKQWPVHDARAWAEQYYLKYPALGIFVYWPPGFAAVEAAVFAIFGVGIAAARSTILLFACASGLLMFALGRHWFDRTTGLLAALLLITCAHGALWLNDVMLEWPATCWILAAVYAYEMDRETRKKRWPVALAAAVAMAFFTKQTAGFILPVLLIHALWQRDRRAYLLRPTLLISLAAALAVIACYWTVSRSYAALPASLLQPSLDLTFYPRHLPEILGWPLLPIALLGLGTFIVEPERRVRGLLLLWLVAWLVFSSSIAGKEPRYLFFALPPMMFAAVRFFLPAARADGRERPLSLRIDAARVILLALLVVAQFGLARWKSTARLPDYAPAVAELATRPDADLVLIDGVRDGQFVFDVYQNPAARDRIIPLRASKLLYARAARTQYDYQQFVQTPDDIVALLNRYGIRYIAIESQLPRTPYLDADPPPRQMLRELLTEDARFQLISRRPLRCADPIWDDVEFQVYAYPQCPPRSSDVLNISFPGMRQAINFRLPPREAGETRR